MRLIEQIRNKNEKINYGKDILAGIIVALVSIPISMGYSQIAGLPAVYGLYGSLFPILIFAFLTTSPQFVVGVDAMPAVMVGSMLATLGIAAESYEAMQIVPLMSILTALWFVIFYAFKAGRVVKYISTPVMGGFISGVGLTIIFMQIPKLFGGNAGTGEIIELIINIVNEAPKFNYVAALLSIGTIVIIMVSKKLIPKVPMAVVMLVVGAILEACLHLENYGVKLLPEVTASLPKLSFPSLMFIYEHGVDMVIQSVSIAAVIMAQTLLATGNYAMKYNDKVDNNKELLAYGGMNFVSGLFGCCPINGSVSRSGIADSYGARSQVMSITAGLTMLIIILFGTPLLKYMPVPVLTGIVMTALWGILEIEMAKKLWKHSRNELFIFIMAFFGVLLLGTVNGVMVGVVLSFAQVAIRAVTPPTSFMGRIPGQGNFHALERNSSTRPIQNTVIYRFSGNLFFANIDKFQNDIFGAVKEDTHQVVVDARGIGSIDVTAVDRLIIINRNLRNQGIKFYITEHDGSLNDKIRKLGGQSLIEDGVIRRTITFALRDAGVEKPYALENYVETDEIIHEADERLSEFEWAFGNDAEEMMEQLAEKAIASIASDVSGKDYHIHAAGVIDEIAGITDKADNTQAANSDINVANETQAVKADALLDERRFDSSDSMDSAEDKIIEKLIDEKILHTSWGVLGFFDENEFLDHLEINLEEAVREGRIKKDVARKLEKHFERRRRISEAKLTKLNPHAKKLIENHRAKIRKHLKERHPDEYMQIKALWNETQDEVREKRQNRKRKHDKE